MGTNGLGWVLLFVIPTGVVGMKAIRAPAGQRWCTVLYQWKSELRDVFLVTLLTGMVIFAYELFVGQPSLIRDKNALIGPPNPVFSAPRPPEILEDFQREIDEIKRQLHSGPRAIPATAFYVHPESEFMSMGAPDRFTGFWAGSPGVQGYTLTPVTHMIFVRVTNLLPVRTMLDRFSARLNKCPTSERIDTISSQVFYTFDGGTVGSPAVGRILAIPNNGTGIYGVTNEIGKADLARGAQVELPLLDRILSDRYLEPQETVGGWVLFDSECMGGEDNFELEDVAGRTFSYSIRHSNEMKTGDLAIRQITVTRAVNLLGSTVRRLSKTP